MKRFIEGADRTQVSLLPECVEDYVEAENPVRVIEAFVEQLDLRALGFEGIDPEVTGRPAYPPSVLLKIPCTEPANSAVERRKWRDCSRFALYKHRWRNRVRETSIDSPNPSATAPWGLRFMGPIKEPAGSSAGPWPTGNSRQPIPARDDAKMAAPKRPRGLALIELSLVPAMEEISLNARTFSPGEFGMLIHEMTEDECGTALEQVGFGRLACVRGDRPYIVPIYFSYDRKHLYGVTTLGQKIEWMRSNPHVCLEIDERTSHYQWMSVVVFGRYEELPDTPEYEYSRAHALEVLQKRVMWWQPACVATEKREQRPPIFYRIHIEQVTGHRATPDAIEAATLGAEETLV